MFKNTDLKMQKNLVLVTFLFIPTILISLFMIYPLIRLVALSFTSWDGLNPTKTFVGLQNFKKIIFDSPEVWVSLKNNGVYFVGHLLFIPIELFLAFLLDQRVRFSKMFKTITFLPYIINTVAVACMFIFLYSSQDGVLNSMLQFFHMDKIGWLSDPKIVNYSLTGVSIWKFSGIHIILFLAAFQSLPTDMIEASIIDGASTFKQFYHIVLPNIKPVVEIVLFLNVRGALQIFDIPYVMTSGGPNHASETFTIQTINTAFQYQNFGLACAMAIVLMIIIIIFSIIQKKLFNLKG
ncbi:Melibiose/raffinose/stachyose import permease protein MelD [Neobacillus rhizosphaerae]|uniref:Melibiose/raffinose/stachyose import permease protein MelD n=1 Tax=Neobacillus rhizosphaerae TaxID=2880965 RepID=A0ABN8KPQ2_9BACI|nr:sugar ABC transporter permease [Neobacillus rhizosphaerae]CAH2715614.1 Melibiose/raffinose/stachyose import permease protein MelD [Neobacillus rhizosphaerae]